MSVVKLILYIIKLEVNCKSLYIFPELQQQMLSWKIKLGIQHK